MSLDLGWVGIWLLVICVAAIVIEAAVAAFWSVRVTRRARELSERLAGQQQQLKADVERLQAALAETAVLWQPYGRLLRWLQHPLAIALLQSFARRWAMVR
jgi:hypothetical protein